MTVVTTLLLPMTLPLIVEVLVGRDLHFDLVGLARFMTTLIFVPVLSLVAFPASLAEGVGLDGELLMRHILGSLCGHEPGRLWSLCAVFEGSSGKVVVAGWWASVLGVFWPAPG